MAAHRAPHAQHTMGACVMTILRSMSRRAFLPLVAGAVLSPVVRVPSAARAQDASWQLYRREDLGFEVEMPGKPKIEVEEFERDHPAVRSIDAVVDVEQISFSAGYYEYRMPITLEQEALAQQLLARGLEARTVRETAFMMSGIEGRDISMEGDGLNAILRIVSMQNRRIMISVMGDRIIHSNAMVRRFLDSLKLLPGGR
jgi:hypothetical protein